MEGPNFEDLGPEGFQRFCQALLVRDYPTLQCLPVAQPDGGRDAFTAEVVFQAKFARNPSDQMDVVTWVTDAIDSELEKVNRLAARGARTYVLLTNVPGSAHLDAGKVDRVQAYLDKHISIPAMCLWRQDLTARLQNAPSLYWAYPGLLDAGHLLQWFIERADPENDRREGTLRTYLDATYDDDQMVRFRQVELENHLLDLYVDVPIRPKRDSGSKPSDLTMLQRRLLERGRSPYMMSHLADDEEDADIIWDFDFEGVLFQNLSAASLLLNSTISADTADVVVEGAPGQGKSTVAQYICQVHRIRLLEKAKDVLRIPQHHRSSPLRIPLKVELRDLATWLRGQDPFRPHNLALPPNHSSSLESLIAWHVEYKTGGRHFSVDDIHAVAMANPVVLVLDGLDEVADIGLRRKVIDEANACINRLRSSAISLQVIATSRPAAFSNSPGFSDRRFAYMELASLTADLVHKYANKWCVVSRASDADRRLIFRVLETKLAQPHIRDLSRNAMQMAILLNLISTLGESLPDARTALYDEYMKLFLRREAEKNTTIAKHRTLIIDIHRYLAWVLQTGAEGDNPQGSISEAALKTLLRDYLVQEGRDPNLADDLFQGILERVVALVTRIEGLFEFDVQPLREYFCARFLYDTAPNSSVGKAMAGSRPDRFDGVSRNPSWLNVTRFFAGCHTKGELAGLKESLDELKEDPIFRLTSYPRQLAFLLLSDWVFEQSPKATTDLVSSLLADLGPRHCLTDEDVMRGSQRLAMECGRRSLFKRCIELLDAGLPIDRERAVSDLARSNSEGDELADAWVRMGQVTSNLTEWFQLGARCSRECFHDANGVDDLLGEGVVRRRRLQCVAESGAVRFFLRSDALVDTFTDLVISSGLFWPIGMEPAGASVLDGFGIVTTLCRRLPLGRGPKGYVRMFMRQFQSEKAAEHIEGWGASASHLEAIGVTVETVTSTMHDLSSMSRSLEPWIAIENTLSPYAKGECWFLYELALRACGVRSTERIIGGEALFDPGASLIVRARFARLRSGSASWWRSTLGAARTLLQRRFALAIVLGWATPRTLSLMDSELNDALEQLSVSEFRELLSDLRVMHSLDGTPRYEARLLSSDLIRLTMALSQRIPEHMRGRVVLPILGRYEGSDPSVDQVRREVELENADRLPAAEALKIVGREYTAAVPSKSWPDARRLKEVSVDTARVIVSDPGRYPLSYVLMAEGSIRKALSAEIVPVSVIAEREHWFRSVR